MLRGISRTRIGIVVSLMVLLVTGTAFATTIGPGTLPTWAADATWTDLQSTYSATSYDVTIPNVFPSDGVNIWFSFVYDRDPYQPGGARYSTDINWGDSNYGYGNYATSEQWFTSTGTATTNPLLGQYGRVTTSVDLYGDLDWESVAFQTLGNSGNITELYVYVNQNPMPVPEPASMTLLGLGIAGLAVRRYRKR